MKLLSAAFALLVVLAPAAAIADVITPDEEACRSKVAGDACILMAGGAGVCVTRTVPVGNPMSGATRSRTSCEAGTATNDAGAVDSGTAADSGSGGGSGGCSVSSRPAHTGRGTLGALGALALGAALGQRRRAKRNAR